MKKIMDLHEGTAHITVYNDGSYTNPYRVYAVYDGGAHRRLLIKYGDLTSVLFLVRDYFLHDIARYQIAGQIHWARTGRVYDIHADEYTPEDFVEDMFIDCCRSGAPEYMTITDARYNLRAIAEEGSVELQKDLTPSLYVMIWNHLVDAWKAKHRT